MRFISDDDKVFNTLEECKEHEAEVKRKAQESEKSKEQAKDLNNLMKMMAEVTEMMDKVNKATEEYEKKWGTDLRSGTGLNDKTDTLSSLIKFLL